MSITRPINHEISSLSAVFVSVLSVCVCVCVCGCEGLGSTGRVQVILFLAGSGGLLPNETTFAKLLQKQGYTTGIVGKTESVTEMDSQVTLYTIQIIQKQLHSDEQENQTRDWFRFCCKARVRNVRNDSMHKENHWRDRSLKNDHILTRMLFQTWVTFEELWEPNSGTLELTDCQKPKTFLKIYSLVFHRWKCVILISWIYY